MNKPLCECFNPVASTLIGDICLRPICCYSGDDSTHDFFQSCQKFINKWVFYAQEEELQKEDPILFQEIIEELGEGQTLADRPEILAEIVAIMLEEDPDLLEKLDEELDAILMEGEFAENGSHDEL